MNTFPIYNMTNMFSFISRDLVLNSLNPLFFIYPPFFLTNRQFLVPFPNLFIGSQLNLQNFKQKKEKNLKDEFWRLHFMHLSIDKYQKWLHKNLVYFSPVSSSHLFVFFLLITCVFQLESGSEPEKSNKSEFTLLLINLWIFFTINDSFLS